jgi:hypothetical protein
LSRREDARRETTRSSNADMVVSMRWTVPVSAALRCPSLDVDIVDDGRKGKRRSGGSGRRAHVGLLLVFRVFPLLPAALTSTTCFNVQTPPANSLGVRSRGNRPNPPRTRRARTKPHSSLTQTAGVRLSLPPPAIRATALVLFDASHPRHLLLDPPLRDHRAHFYAGCAQRGRPHVERQHDCKLCGLPCTHLCPSIVAQRLG